MFNSKVAETPVFIVGSGRSGTNWVGQILQSHPEIVVTIEVSPIFQWVTAIALDPRLETDLLPKLLRAYEQQLQQAAPLAYADKSHPNLWLADHLRAAFPSSRFVGIERNPFATVASMMRHHKVADWHRRWREFPLPNRFLGINGDLADQYEALPLAEKCALRWLAHHRELNRLRETLGSCLLVLTYETLLLETARELSRLESFLKLESPIPAPDVKVESLEKWRSQLSLEEKKQIADVVGFDPA